MWLRGSKIAYVLLPLAVGCALAIAIRITGFALLTFVDTPLARLLTAVQTYVWLLDVLVNTYLQPHPSPNTDSQWSRQSNATAFTRVSIAARQSIPPAVPPKSRSFCITREIRVSPFGSLRNDTGDEIQSADRVNYSEHRKTLSLGPVIRRGSRLPSWITGARPASKASTQSMLPYDAEHSALSDLETNEGGAVRDRAGEPRYATRVRGREHDEPVSLTLQSVLESTETSRKVSAAHQAYGGAVNVYLTTTTRENSEGEGAKLDSPLDTPLGFGVAYQPPSSKHETQPGARKPTTPLPSPSLNVQHSNYGDRLDQPSSPNDPDPARLSVSVGRNSSPSASEQEEDLSRNTSLYSRISRLSLSGFPAPPLVTGKAITRRSLRHSRCHQQEHHHQHRSTTPVKEALNESDVDPLEPPIMPAASQMNYHAPSPSWQSDDTFTGSTKEGLLPPASHKGYNVTS